MISALNNTVFVIEAGKIRVLYFVRFGDKCLVWKREGTKIVLMDIPAKTFREHPKDGYKGGEGSEGQDV